MKTFIRKIKQGKKVKYAEVWNERRGKKVIQHHVRYLGTDPKAKKMPQSFDIEKVHFGYLAQLILSDELTPEEVYLMLLNKGEPIKKQSLDGIAIKYGLREKNLRIQLIVPRKK